MNKYGHDIAINRTDDLDKLALEYVQNNPNVKVLDIGSGAAGLSKKLVEAGAQVTAVDIEDHNISFADLTNCEFIQADIRQFVRDLEPKVYDSAVLQRVIHYLPHRDAQQVLTKLAKCVNLLFISFSGVESAIADHHTSPEAPITDRFSTLDSIGAGKFHITSPICLYSKIEVQKILNEAGWKVERIWQSDFGNIKSVCTRK